MFYSSQAIADSTEGSWDFKTRKFLASEKKEDLARLGHMEDTMNAKKFAFISKDHQEAKGMDDDECSVESRLTKADATPDNVANEDVSILTGSTRKSKAKAYGPEAVNEISRQYDSTIGTLNDKLSSNDAELA